MPVNRRQQETEEYICFIIDIYLYDKTFGEWNIGQCDFNKTFNGHSDEIIGAVYSPDNGRVLTFSKDTTLKEWDLVMCTKIRSFVGHNGEVNYATYNEDGTKIFSSSSDMDILEWNVNDKRILKVFDGYNDDQEGKLNVTKEIYIVSCKPLKSINNIVAWSAVEKMYDKKYSKHTDAVTSLSFSKDKKFLFSSSKDKTIKEWNLQNGECVRNYEEHHGEITYIDSSPTEHKFLSASGDKTIREWDQLKGTCIKKYNGHTEKATCVKYKWDGRKFFTASEDKTIKEWDIKTGICERTFYDYHGLIIQGCKFYNLHKDSYLTSNGMEIFIQYGAEF